MKKINLGYAICGSFCNFENSIKQLEILSKKNYEIFPIMSFNAFGLDTKFGKAKDFNDRIESICNKKIINTIVMAEPIGPKKLLDIITISPCTGNTLSKICNAIIDTPVTMAVKSHLRIQRPVVIVLATNDALGTSGQNLGKALNMKNIYFVPLEQDDYIKKPNSLVSNFELLDETIKLALEKIQIQPIFL
ncbi:MAG: dipicolinate synthase subunit B [Candidatus Paraimprobicoccus trichonymphae]|uniref:Dipicolinate synthase subunit B n=1 Tax=Candidatus Paraimprobicoccus trichonymphae TaxID=3033793 RepID=A0AA48KZ36_9FIRM|nr:MAG: dipicolinate synthase subunit B [Candidatus Paraimprobicoccus trichonymphae]